ncbi:MAG: hypothetical protein EZS28_004485 [Streblomastix strix]|uniref:Uncharacterized protein n=1 Tax=Streblomastix strix TaxID=222440 RepID=A0A5J4X0K1_9EUKA|nr:MAG: hypothetical protein EZS28_004485 [Streblomastix strix]
MSIQKQCESDPSSLLIDKIHLECEAECVGEFEGRIYNGKTLKHISNTKDTRSWNIVNYCSFRFKFKLRITDCNITNIC